MELSGLAAGMEELSASLSVVLSTGRIASWTVYTKHTGSLFHMICNKVKTETHIHQNKSADIV